jgi:hypothetical protein
LIDYDARSIEGEASKSAPAEAADDIDKKKRTTQRLSIPNQHTQSTLPASSPKNGREKPGMLLWWRIGSCFCLRRFFYGNGISLKDGCT